MATLWQMPMAYQGVIEVVFSRHGASVISRGVGALASLAGACVMWAMAGWLE